MATVKGSILCLAFAAAMGGELQFREHEIATGLSGGYQLTPADLNGDGRIDLIALASGMKELVWFENPSWSRHVLAPIGRAINLAAADADGDGVPEIVLAAGWAMVAAQSPGNVWLLQRGADPAQPWAMKEIDQLPTSHRIRVARIAGSLVFVNAPLIGANSVAPAYDGSTPLVFYRPGEWKRQLFSEQNQGVVHGLEVLDWDGDGNDDLLTAGFEGVQRFFRRANGDWARERIVAGDPAPWPKSGASEVAVGRKAGKRFLATVEPWHGNQVAVYEEVKGEWQRRVIDAKERDIHRLRATDMDGDGADELVVAVRGPSRRVVVYSASQGEWKKTIVDDGGIAAADCAAVDLNGDRRLDLACIGSATANLKWYENVNRSR